MRSATSDVSWLAIHQPGVVRLLESHLRSADGDLLAVGLELTWQLLRDAATRAGSALPRLAPEQLRAGVSSSMQQPVDAEFSAWVQAQLGALPQVLTRAEEHNLAQVMAAVAWAVTSTHTPASIHR